MMKTVVVVPVYNEGDRVIKVVGEILKVDSDIKVVVVDDGSIDNSYELLKKNFSKIKRVWLLKHEINLGKGSAMKTGVRVAKKLKSETVIFVDGDGQHNPKYIPQFVEVLKDKEIVFGYRQLNGEMPFVRKWGNIFAKKLLALLFKIKRKEFLCGFMGFRMNVFGKIKWKSNRYGVETEIATKVAKNNLSYSEIIIDTIYVDKYKGVSLIDAVKVLLKIPIWYFSK